MECPKCNATMEKVTHQNIEVDRCTHCHGLWFEMLEQEQLKALEGSEAVDIGDADTGAEYNRVENINCPSCHSGMVRMVDKQQPHIWYESCPSCHGVFFDAGEFTDYKNYTFGDMIKSLFTQERS